MVREVRFYMPATQHGVDESDDATGALGATAQDVSGRLPERWTDWLDDDEDDGA